MRQWRVGLGVLGLSLVAATGWSWSGSGHQIVALLAWKHMSAEQRTSAVALLRNLPEFQADIGQRVDPLPAEQRDEATFAIAATWPDIIRSRTTASHIREHHANWHYTDMPMLETGTSFTMTLPTVEWEKKPGHGPANSVQAIRDQVAVLDDPTTSAERHAVALAWIMHLSGDMVQPLHSAALFGERWPRGDKGGNDFFVALTPGAAPENLHHFWDSQFGEEYPFNSVEAKANDIAADPKLTTATLSAQIQDLDPVSWTREGGDLARKYAYELDSPHPLQGVLRSGGAEAPALTPEYRAQSLELARHQVAVGGGRLAAIIGKHLK